MKAQNTTRGITLIECIVAVTILAVAIGGPLTLASQSLRASRDAREEFIATHLAEEAIEVAHSIRSNNSADDTTNTRTAWMNGIMGVCDSGQGCVVDVTAHGNYPQPVWSSPLLSCPGGNCANVSQIYYNPSTGLYRQSLSALSSPWQTTPYKRWLTVTPIDDPSTPMRQVRLTSTVTYIGYGGQTHTVSITDDLYNWFPNIQ